MNSGWRDIASAPNQRIGQSIFNFLEWLKERGYTGAQNFRMADPFHISDEKWISLWAEYSGQPLPPPPGEELIGELAQFVTDQREFSLVAFGPNSRALGNCQHIAKELDEIRAKPDDLSEWIDVILLACDGYWRNGGAPESLIGGMQAKLAKNKARKWPPYTGDDTKAVEHDRTGEEQTSTLPEELCDTAWIEGAKTAANYLESGNPQGLDMAIAKRHAQIAEARRQRKEQSNTCDRCGQPWDGPGAHCGLVKRPTVPESVTPPEPDAVTEVEHWRSSGDRYIVISLVGTSEHQTWKVSLYSRKPRGFWTAEKATLSAAILAALGKAGAR